MYQTSNNATILESSTRQLGCPQTSSFGLTHLIWWKLKKTKGEKAIWNEWVMISRFK